MSPLTRSRSRNLDKIRMAMSEISSDATTEQQASELKRLTKSSRLEICGKAGVKQNLHVDKKLSTALRLQRGVLYHTFRKQKKMLKKSVCFI